MMHEGIIANQPGITIKEQLEDRNISQKEFALRMEMSEKHISKLINGEVLLTTDMALRLENVLGISAQYWMNLEAIYRYKLAQIEAELTMNDELKIVSNFPYNEMASLGWVPETSSKKEKVLNLRKFFEVNRLGLLFDDKKLNVLCRRISESEKADYALMAWAQKAKIESRSIKTSKINIAKLKEKIQVFRQMTKEVPNVFCPKLIDELAANGIAIVFLPHLGGSFLHGATFYDNNKIVIGLTVRGKDADKFWFSFFHELGHIILNHIDKDYYDSMEEEANEFAKDALIPSNKYKEFITNNIFSDRSIIEFSQNIGIDFGIVVGRLQKDNLIPYSKFNNLKTKYMIS